MEIQLSEEERGDLLLAIGCILHSIRKDYRIVESEKIKKEQARFEALQKKILAIEEAEKC